MTKLLQLGVIGYDQWQVTANGGTLSDGLPAIRPSILFPASHHDLPNFLNLPNFLKRNPPVLDHPLLGWFGRSTCCAVKSTERGVRLLHAPFCRCYLVVGRRGGLRHVLGI